ncbi:MAG: rubrerythrin family protein [Oligoflexia bacterium]|nr:rubrerythrin family protein [Oligoflexia bacterium]
MELKGSKTEKNILTAFAGESQARNRYTYYAGIAKKEGLEQIAAILEETAQQEKEHAKRLFKFLKGGEVEVKATFPAGVLGKTVDNLRDAAAGEHHEWIEMYPAFATIAREEGFNDIAKVFDAIAVAEKLHETRYLSLRENLENGKIFKKHNKSTWYCRNCGYTQEGTDAPLGCPACAHPQAHFEILSENWR